jgi:rhodanese-related sulfurtransferase
MPTKNPQEPFYRLTVAEAKELLGEGAHVIDVRNPDEYANGHVAGAPLIPVNSVFARREELPKEGKLIFICSVGQRSALACEMAAAGGIPAERLYNVEGGTDAWVKAGELLEK